MKNISTLEDKILYTFSLLKKPIGEHFIALKDKLTENSWTLEETILANCHVLEVILEAKNSESSHESQDILRKDYQKFSIMRRQIWRTSMVVEITNFWPNTEVDEEI